MSKPSIKVQLYSPSESHLTEEENALIDSARAKYINRPLLHKIVIHLSNKRKISNIYDNTDDVIMEYHSMTYRPDFIRITVMKYLWSLMVRSDRIAPPAGLIQIVQIEWYLLDENYNPTLFKHNVFREPVTLDWNPLYNGF
jgi:hypothetical protein